MMAAAPNRTQAAPVWAPAPKAAAPTDSAHSPSQSAGALSTKPRLLGSFGSGTGMRFSRRLAACGWGENAAFILRNAIGS